LRHKCAVLDEKNELQRYKLAKKSIHKQDEVVETQIAMLQFKIKQLEEQAKRTHEHYKHRHDHRISDLLVQHNLAIAERNNIITNLRRKLEEETSARKQCQMQLAELDAQMAGRL
jgi:predicted RNase H-like nuclease (RuvC/YqgF family)